VLKYAFPPPSAHGRHSTKAQIDDQPIPLNIHLRSNGGIDGYFAKRSMALGFNDKGENE
jgi:hypothetical protein